MRFKSSRHKLKRTDPDPATKNRIRPGASILALLLLSLSPPLFAEKAASLESAYPLDQTKQKIDEVLQKVDADRYEYLQKTYGFSYLASSRWNSPFSYDIYFGTVSAQNPTAVIRIEGAAGDILLMKRVFELEKLTRTETDTPDETESDKKVAYALSPKYHLIAQTMNLAAPWSGVLYESYRSPRLTRGQTVFRFTTFFLADAFLAWAGGRNWFRDRWNPSRYGGNIAAALAVPRLIGLVQSANLVRGHNRLVELQYTFYRY